MEPITDHRRPALRVVLLGPPASGKGTQGRRLAASCGLAYLSTGALLREAVERQTPLGIQAKPILDRGGYLPDELMLPLIADWLEHHPGGWVLDGFPRSKPQAEFLDQWLERHGLALDAAIVLEAPFDVLFARIHHRVECPECRWSGQRAELAETGACPKCGGIAAARDDDDEENFRSRFAAYERITGPAIEYFATRGELVRCSAIDAPEVVADRILAALNVAGGARDKRLE